MNRVAVCSKSFSKNPVLRAELQSRYPVVKFNDAGRELVGAELVEFLKGHDRAIIGLEKLNAAILKELPELKIISKYGVGLDSIDFPALRAAGVKLAWTGGVNRRSVAELVIAQMIILLRQLAFANGLVRTNAWRQVIGAQLTGKTVGIVGLGRIGRDLVGLLKPFGCRVLAYDIERYDSYCQEHDVEQTSLDSLLKQSDIVTVHVPLDESTRAMIAASQLKLMKPTALLINSARGGIVAEADLKTALMNGVIAGAAFDVFEIEPATDKELLELPNFFATPHIGGSAAEAVLAMGQAAIDGLEKSVEADPKNFK